MASLSSESEGELFEVNNQWLSLNNLSFKPLNGKSVNQKSFAFRLDCLVTLARVKCLNSASGEISDRYVKTDVVK